MRPGPSPDGGSFRSGIGLGSGGPDHRLDFRIHMPAALTYPLAGRTYNWWYESGPEPSLGGRQIYQPRGKVLCGSSTINGMIFIRGNPMDFDGWANCQGWSPGAMPMFCRTLNGLKIVGLAGMITGGTVGLFIWKHRLATIRCSKHFSSG